MKNIDKGNVLRRFRDAVLQRRIPLCESLSNQVNSLVHEARMSNLETIFNECKNYTDEQKEETKMLLEKKMESRVNEIKALRKEVDKILRLQERLEK